MDSDNEIARAKWLLIAIVVFFVSGCISWGELAYLLRGQETGAEITKVYEITRRRRFGSESKELRVEYRYTEPDGTQKNGSDTVARDWPIRAIDDKIAIRFIAGDDESRLVGHVNWIGLSLFSASLIALGIFIIKIWREANEAASYSPKKRR